MVPEMQGLQLLFPTACWAHPPCLASWMCQLAVWVGAVSLAPPPQPWATSHCAAGATSGVHMGKDAARLAGNSGLENMEGSARRSGGDNIGGQPMQLGSCILSAAHPTDSGRSFPMLNCFLFPSGKALGGLSALVSTQIHALQGIIPRCYLSDAA